MTLNRGRGRPRNDNRAAARIVGDLTYTGKTCKKCEAAERYTSNGACVTCQTRAGNASRRLIANAGGVDAAIAQMDADTTSAIIGAEAPTDDTGDPEPVSETDLDDLMGPDDLDLLLQAPDDLAVSAVCHPRAKTRMCPRSGISDDLDDLMGGTETEAEPEEGDGISPPLRGHKRVLARGRHTGDTPTTNSPIVSPDTTYAADHEAGCVFIVTNREQLDLGIIEEIDEATYDRLAVEGYRKI